MADMAARQHFGTIVDARFGLLIAAVVIYAGFGAPTPDMFGWAEITVGILLVLAVGVGGLVRLMNPASYPGLWYRAGWILMIYGLSLPLITALVVGNSPALILRDVIPFLFFLMPLFLYGLVTARTAYAPILTTIVIFSGIAFAGRLVLAPMIEQGGFSLAYLPHSDPLYLANAPTVLFAALLCIGSAGYVLYQKPASKKNVIRAIILLGLAILPLVAMAAVMQRASFGVLFAALVFLLALGLLRAPLRAIWPLIAGLWLLVLVWPVLVGLTGDLAAKTSMVGFNNRIQETQAVVAMLDDHIWHVLFGRGWGQSFVSPAVGGVEVNFTHNLLTAMWLKSGLIGVGFTLLYLGGLLACLWRILWASPVRGIALAGPFMICVLLYASYKSLDFGLLLLLLPLWAKKISNVA